MPGTAWERGNVDEEMLRFWEDGIKMMGDFLRVRAIGFLRVRAIPRKCGEEKFWEDEITIVGTRMRNSGKTELKYGEFSLHEREEMRARKTPGKRN
ncbi:hypothetical protein ANCDUO_05970 [Ancylostoma duodenale]|uniref:Uncharacterized protein n=1 Tax=Ancylostoma duodenale TaxID=51022 RepID=A0A0C2D2V8_9BILA|nr:hypothetical protein ANCDUO_05970 [Ancylostoma duodenale]